MFRQPDLQLLGELMDWVLTGGKRAADTLRGAQLAFPRSYLVFDLETTGFHRSSDLIWNIGWAAVDNGQITAEADLILDWTSVSQLDQAWLRERIDRQRAEMPSTQLTYERLRAGCDPHDCLEALAGVLNTYANEGGWIVGHGVRAFDRPVVDNHLQRFFDGLSVAWDKARLLDTGLVEKALQLGMRPWPGDTLQLWYSRVASAGGQVKWALFPYCVERYDLATRYGLDIAAAHTAMADCQFTRALLETYQELVTNG